MNALSPAVLDEMFRILEYGDGFKVFSVNKVDLVAIRNLVKEQYLSVLKNFAPEHCSRFEEQPLYSYHQIADEINLPHDKIWSKLSRVFDKALLKKFKETDLYKDLLRTFGEFQIADEEKLQHENVYWRLVRPGMPDVGSIHADKWFWDLGHGVMPEGYFRLKLWLAIFTQPGSNGLRVVPNSQKRNNWLYHSVCKGGINKPVIDHSDNELDLCDLPLSAGQFVIFHDALLHGGMPNAGSETRFSLEFTLLLPKALLVSVTRSSN